MKTEASSWVPGMKQLQPESSFQDGGYSVEVKEPAGSLRLSGQGYRGVAVGHCRLRSCEGLAMPGECTCNKL